jgi:hypothetical protein
VEFVADAIESLPFQNQHTLNLLGAGGGADSINTQRKIT